MTVTGGEGEGITGRKGEGLSGTYIKDTRTKPKRGRIMGGKWRWLGWGENGDNCT